MAKRLEDVQRDIQAAFSREMSLDEAASYLSTMVYQNMAVMSLFAPIRAVLDAKKDIETLTRTKTDLESAVSIAEADLKAAQDEIAKIRAEEQSRVSTIDADIESRKAEVSELDRLIESRKAEAKRWEEEVAKFQRATKNLTV